MLAHRYVTRKNVHDNMIVVSKTYHQPDKKRDTFVCRQINWIAGDMPSWWREQVQEGNKAPPPDLVVKVRHGPKMSAVKSIEFGYKDAAGDWVEADVPEEGASWASRCIRVQLNEDDQGLAPGQYAVLYHNNVCLGSGIIM